MYRWVRGNGGMMIAADTSSPENAVWSLEQRLVYHESHVSYLGLNPNNHGEKPR
jgi:hypothetical protein